MGDTRRQADIATMHARTANDALVEGLRHEKAALQGARRGLTLGLLAGGIVFVVAVGLFVALRASTPNESDTCKREHAGFIDISPSCPEPLRIERDGDLILAHPGASLEERGNGWRLRGGRASFVAKPRDGGNALRVFVSHGVIEVTGTRFTVDQHEDRGQVKVDEGTVVFYDDAGGDVVVGAGSKLAWPRPQGGNVVALGAIPLEAPKPSSTRRAAAAPKPGLAKTVEPAPVREEDQDVEEEGARPAGVMSMEDILTRISTLRRQKRTREAIELLVTQSRRGDITEAQMARLSWEIGLFVQDSGDQAAACNHWKSHARKYTDDAAHAERVRNFIAACETRP